MLTPIEKKILEKFARGKVKPAEKFMYEVKNPITKKTLRFTTVNLTPQEQTIANRLFNKGFLEASKGKGYFHELVPSRKFNELRNKTQ